MSNFNNDKTAWSASGKVVPGSGQKVKLQTEFPDIGTYKVQFGIQGPDENGSSGVRKTKALISWSVEGNSITREIDVINGTSIIGAAEAISVEAVDESFPGAGPSALREYVITVLVVKGVRSSVEQPPYRTTPFLILDPGPAAAAVDVPEGSGAISIKVSVAPSILGQVILPEQVQIQFYGGPALLKAYNPLVDPGWVPLPGGCTRVVFQTVGATEPPTPATPPCYCFITFGIDG